MTTENSQNRIEELKTRWEKNSSSRVFVQLAEEYRRQGQLEEAISVLEKGLAEQPNYLTAQVTLGRCLLESGRAEKAVEMLSRVMEQDPSHPLAGKLLVEAHLEMGQIEEANTRLDLYRMMADNDSEVERLEARLQAARETPDQAQEPTGVPGGAADSERTPTHAPPTGAPSTGTSPTETSPTENPDIASGAGGSSAGADESEDVFDLGDLDLNQGSEESALEESNQAPFALDPVDADAPLPASPASTESASIDVATPATSTEPTSTEPASDEPFGDLLGGESGWPDSQGAQAEDDVFGLADEAEEEAAVGSPEQEPDENREEATVTLGQLYMSQGHDEEAVRIFQSVLQRDPTNEVSRTALAQLEARREARDESTEAPPAQEPPKKVESPPTLEPAPPVPEGTGLSAELEGSGDAGADAGDTGGTDDSENASKGITARKISALEGYLERLRRAAG